MRAYLHTLGCKVNAVETDSIAALLRDAGHTITDVPADADLIVLNTCTVTASGDHRMRRTLHRLRAAAPGAVIVLTGCYVQAFPDDAAALPEADILVGTGGRAQIPALAAAFREDGVRRTLCLPHPRGEAFETLPVGTDAAHTRAFLKLQDGCDRFCTYCIIPYARGRSRSCSAAQLRADAAALVGKGYREIVLCGIDLAAWQDGPLDLADAAAICADAGAERIRLGSLEPQGLSRCMLARLAAVTGVCPQLHIASQSGSDRILAAMHRRCTSAQFLALLDDVRAFFPNCAVSTDIMTGFPGETDADHAASLAFAERAGFARMHVFRWSPRPGTPAASYPDQVPETVKKARAEALQALSARQYGAFLASCVGGTEAVLFERERDGVHRGHTPRFAPVRIPAAPGAPSLRGQVRPVRIVGVGDGALAGELV